MSQTTQSRWVSEKCNMCSCLKTLSFIQPLNTTIGHTAFDVCHTATDEKDVPVTNSVEQT
jgi:hypothetical protein